MAWGIENKNLGLSLNILQNSTIGSPVFQVVASDPDDPNTANGRLRYRLLDNGKFGRDTLAFSIGTQAVMNCTARCRSDSGN